MSSSSSSSAAKRRSPSAPDATIMGAGEAPAVNGSAVAGRVAGAFGVISEDGEAVKPPGRPRPPPKLPSTIRLLPPPPSDNAPRPPGNLEPPCQVAGVGAEAAAASDAAAAVPKPRPVPEFEAESIPGTGRAPKGVGAASDDEPRVVRDEVRGGNIGESGPPSRSRALKSIPPSSLILSIASKTPPSPGQSPPFSGDGAAGGAEEADRQQQHSIFRRQRRKK